MKSRSHDGLAANGLVLPQVVVKTEVEFISLSPQPLSPSDSHYHHLACGFCLDHLVDSLQHGRSYPGIALIMIRL